MDYLVWIGGGVTLCGLAAILYSLVAVIRARRAGLSEDDLRDRLRRIVPVNLGALLLSFFGLILVIVGVILG